jgi:hypothetical protein
MGTTLNEKFRLFSVLGFHGIFCLTTWRIGLCWSVNRDRFIENILLARLVILAEFSHFEWSSFLGADYQVI